MLSRNDFNSEKERQTQTPTQTPTHTDRHTEEKRTLNTSLIQRLNNDAERQNESKQNATQYKNKQTKKNISQH